MYFKLAQFSFSASPQRRAKLSMSSVNLSGFPPKESISYSKETQTPVETQQEQGKGGKRMAH